MLAVNSNAQKVISHFNFDNSATMKKCTKPIFPELIFCKRIAFCS
ncbi:hypothetical protein M096_1126 [Parabacteroides distasonis str. 3999B T(B) 6]|nr:hypothetical protein M095_4807 [Parabacteroides distasonis str. 3999B T(B) 4]KDS63084.1 hypothetical protein M096_1126 [Parabacteroides distasonis str. 3999B T(B) 6]